MNILEQGQQIITKSGRVKGTITAACIRGGNISYEVSYFSNNAYSQCWMYAFEFDVDSSEKKSPGFNHPSNQLKLTDKGNS